MFGYLNNEEREIIDKHLEEGGEFVLRGHRFKNDVNGDLYVMEDGKWVEIGEAYRNTLVELTNLIRNLGTSNPAKETPKSKEAPKSKEVSEDKEVKIVDVSINKWDVTCTFSDGKRYTAHCHEQDIRCWSLETGISVCVGKWFAGGSSEYNRLIRKGMKVYKNKCEENYKKHLEERERKRIQENKKKKHERYLKRREERRAAEKNDKEDTLVNLMVSILKDIGIDIEVVKV